MTRIFICYRHEDEKWKHRLVTHFGVLAQDANLELWDGRRIAAGDDWLPDIEGALRTCDVALLLISAAFLTSNFIIRREVPRLLERRKSEGVRVIPVILRPCAWTKVSCLKGIQARPGDGRALTSLTENGANEALTALVEEVSSSMGEAVQKRNSHTSESQRQATGAGAMPSGQRLASARAFDQVDCVNNYEGGTNIATGTRFRTEFTDKALPWYTPGDCTGLSCEQAELYKLDGNSQEVAKRAWAESKFGRAEDLGEPNEFETRQSSLVIHHSIDAHPLIREFFAKRLQWSNSKVWKAAHSRLFVHLKRSAPTSKINQTFRAGLPGWACLDLRALGRFQEPANAGEVALSIWIQNQSWKNAGTSLGYLCGIAICLGNLTSAIERGREGVEHAKRSGDLGALAILKMTLAGALFRAGRETEAIAAFREVDILLIEGQSSLVLPANVDGLFFDMQLAESARMAWRMCLGAAAVPVGRRVSEEWRNAKERIRLRRQAVRDGEVFDLLHLPLTRLTLFRIAFYEGVLGEKRRAAALQIALHQIGAAIDGFRSAGHSEFIPFALCCRGWLRAVQGQPDLARADLDEAWQVAERGPMRLDMADIHFHHARIFRDKEELKCARVLIELCGCWRRKEELEGAEEAAKTW